MSENIRIDGTTIHIEGLPPIQLTDNLEAWNAMSNQEKASYVSQLVQMLKPTQKARAAAQGATFGFSDEMIAAATNPLSALSAAMGGEGQEYYDRLASERQKLEQYRQQYPTQSLLFEGGGAVASGLATLPFTGGGSTAATGTQLARLGRAIKHGAKVGAVEGGVYGFGQAEGGLGDRLRGSAIGTAFGATFGVAAEPAMALAGMTSRNVTKLAKKMFGNKGGEAVEATIQQLAEATGLSNDAIVKGVADGSIMAENETLMMTVRALMSKGGPAEAAVREVFDETPESLRAGVVKRPQRKRNEMKEAVESKLARNNELTEKNPLVVEADFDKAVKKAEQDDYAKIEGYTTTVVPLEINRPIIEAIYDFPDIASELENVILSRSRGEPFIQKTKGADGRTVVSLKRSLTLQEAEEARRWFRDTGRSFDTGNARKTRYNEYRQQLEAPLFNFSDELRQANTKAAKTRQAQKLFKEGQSVFNKSSDEVEVLLREHMGDDQMMKSFRAGALAQFRKKMEARGAGGFAKAIANPQTKEAKIMELIFSKEELDELFPKIAQAAQTQEAAGRIIAGPTTALTEAAGENLGKQVNAGDVAGVLTTPFNPIGGAAAAVNIGTKLASQLRPDLSPQQRLRVVEILLSENPDVVQNALVDEAGIKRFQQALDAILFSGVAGARRVPTQMFTTDDVTSGVATRGRGLLAGP